MKSPTRPYSAAEKRRIERNLVSIRSFQAPMYNLVSISVLVLQIPLVIPVQGLETAEGSPSALADRRSRAMYGCAVGGIGDLNNDHVPDFFVGDCWAVARSDGDPRRGEGVVWLVSGLDGHTIRILSGGPDSIEYGQGVVAIGDLDGDGCRDLGVSSWVQSVTRSYALYSSATGSRLLERELPSGKETAISQILSIGDLNRKGRDDIVAVESPAQADRIAGWRIRVIAGENGEVLLDLPKDRAPWQSPVRAAVPGDVDGDTVRDIAVCVIEQRPYTPLVRSSAIGSSELRGVEVIQFYSGKDGSLIRETAVRSPAFGRSRPISGCGDLDLDGVPDLLVGFGDDYSADGDRPHFPAVALSSRRSDVLFELRPSGGSSIVGVGDVTGDGRPDILVGCIHSGLSGTAGVYSGADGSRFYGVSAKSMHQQRYLGYSVAGVEDVDSDGCDDILVGNCNPWGFSPGSVALLSGKDGTLLQLTDSMSSAASYQKAR